MKPKKEKQPKNWRKVKWGEIVNVYGGGTPSTPNPNFWGGNIAWLTPAEVVALNGNRFIGKTKRYITEEGLKNSSARLMPINSLLLTSRATIGEIVINKIPMATNQGFINIEPKNNDLMFLFYWLKKNRKYFNQMAIGSTFNELSKSVFKKIDILIPKNIADQKRIGNILSAFDDKIELNNKINQNLEQIAQAIFKEWFVKFKFPGYKKAEFVNSEFGKIPKNWEVKKIEDIMEFLNGEYIPNSRYDPKGEYIIYGSNSIMGRSDKYLYKGPLIIIAKIGSYCGAIRYSQIPCWVNNNAGGIKGKKDIPTSFIYYLLERFNFNQVREGSGQPFINMKGLREQKVILPSPKILKLFENNIDKIRIYMAKIEKENQKLTSLRDLLLPKLMREEIRV